MAVDSLNYLPGLNFYNTVNDIMLDWESTHDTTHGQKTRYYSYRTSGAWGLTSPGIPVSPDVNTQLVEVPGSNTYINLSKVLTGENTYKLREGSFKLKYIADRSDLATLYSGLTRQLNGRELYMVSDEQPGMYYHGMFEVGELKSSKSKITVTVKYKLDPFKIAIQPTSVTEYFSSNMEESVSQIDDFVTPDRDSLGGTYFKCTSGCFDFTDSSIASIEIRLPGYTTVDEASEVISFNFTDSNGYTGTIFTSKTAIKNKEQIGGYYCWNLVNPYAYPAPCDMSKIVAISVTGWRYCQLWARTAGTILNIPSCDDKISPLISVPSTEIYMVCGGKKYTFTETGGQYLDGFYIHSGQWYEQTELAFGTATSGITGNITVSYYARWL